MAFPFTYSKSLKFNSNDYWIEEIPENFHKLVQNTIQNNGYAVEEGWFKSTRSLFNIPFKFKIETSLNDPILTVKYQLQLQNFVNGILVFILLTAFFSNFEFAHFLWFGFVISVAFFQLSLLIINTGMKKMISHILRAYRKVKNESDIESWVVENNQNCPACGEPLDNRNFFCDNCGLKVRQNPYSKPLNVEQDDTTNEPKNIQNNIRYHIKSK